MNNLPLIFVVLLCVIARIDAVRIGIVGGGIGGCSAALYLRRLFGAEAEIQLYEAGRIGGRLATEEIAGYSYESGGSVIHIKNKCMMDLIEDLGLQTKSAMDGTFGLFDGQQLAFVSSAWPGVTTVKLFWRYGYDVIRLQRLLSATLAKFSSIYSLLDSGAAYDTVEDLITAMDPSLAKLTGLPLSQYLKLSGFQERFIGELVTAVTLTNYGQRPDNMHALVGLVALAGAGDQLTSVLGGNWQVAQRALQTSGATLHRERVTAVELADDGFQVDSVSDWSSDSDSDSSVSQSRPFDVVVVAAPQTADQRWRLQWRGLPAPPGFPGQYHRLSVTLVEAQALPEAFSATSLPSEILCTAGCPADALNSLGSLTPVNASVPPPDVPVQKLFSNTAPSDQLMRRLFGEPQPRQRHVSWLAYPQYQGRLQSAELGNFTLVSHLYYLSSVERAASAMEMSALAARNVANMAYTRWFSRPPPDVRKEGHTEL